MTRVVTSSREAVVAILVAGPAQQPESIEAVIDTGFDGLLCLPPALINRLGLLWQLQGNVVLADGSTTLFDVYEGFIFWGHRAVRMKIDAAGTIPLIGMALLDGFRLTIDFRSGGAVSIKPLPD